MAKRLLDQEADMMYHLLWEKGGGKAVRKILNKEFHVFRMSYQATFDNFMKIRPKGAGTQGDTLNPNPKKWGARVFENKEDNLKELVFDLISAMATIFKTDSKTKKVKLIEEEKTHLKFSIEAPPEPYAYIQKVKKDASEQVFKNSKYQWILKETGLSAGRLSHVGHVEGVAKLKGRLAESFFEGNSTNEQDFIGPREAGPVDTEYLNSLQDAGLKAYQQKMKELMPSLDITHFRNVNIKNGVLENIVQVETDLDSAFHNEIIMANSKLEAPHSEKEISDLIKEAYKAGQKAIHDKFVKDGASAEVNKARSQPFMEAMKGALAYGRLRKLAKKGSSGLKIKKPQPIQPRTSEAKNKKKKHAIKLKKLEHGNISATGGLPKSQAPRGTTESSTSVAPLMALLQAKLPETVAKNMGPPALENQTGRFASSVRITDVMTTAQGHPSVGYTYQKNPYQVFEVGQGDPRWATPQRDPRRLIDASVREIAAQFAIGRFYTRRV